MIMNTSTITLTDEQYQKLLDVAAMECRTVQEVISKAVLEYIGEVV